MERAETIRTGIAAGAFDEVFSRLYGKAAEERQRERYGNLAAEFLNRYGDRGIMLFSAPGRTELGGNHTDHNNGQVLAGSVNLDFIAAASPSGDRTVRVYSEGFENEFVIDLSDLSANEAEHGTFEALVRGVAAKMHQRGIEVRGFSACIVTDVLPGSGLSSSAAVEVLIGSIFNTFYNDGKLSSVELAKIGQYAENVYFGKPCGLMDQMACAVGGIIEIDFADPHEPEFRQVSYSFEENGYALVVVDTGGNHADLTPDYAAAPAEMRAVAAYFGKETLRGVTKAEVVSNVRALRERTGDRAILRSLHYFSDNERVERMIEALRVDRLKEYLALVRESGRSSWELLQNCYTTQNPSEQGITLALALTADFLSGDGACRVHGGGFAGTIQAYIPLERFDAYRKLMESTFQPGCVTRLQIRKHGVLPLVMNG